MNLTTEILNYEAQLDKLLKALKNIDPSEADLLIAMNAYICIRITGYIEISLDEILLSYAKKETNNQVFVNVIKRYLEGFNSANNEKIKTMLETFDTQWKDDYVEEVARQSKGKQDLVQALKSIYDLRNKIAHGRDVNLGVSQLKLYYEASKTIVRIIVRVIQ